MKHITTSPHLRHAATTQTIMRDVLVALLPIIGFATWHFGWRTLLLVTVTAAACVLTEYVYQKAMKLPTTAHDLSAAVTGVILALNLPVTMPLWMAVLGGVFAVLVVKQLFGGLGQNFMNPAMAARAFLFLSFSTRMTAFSETITASATPDMMASATPLQALKNGTAPDLLSLLFGTCDGVLGETCAIAIAVGFAYLVLRGVIRVHIPLLTVGTCVLCAGLFAGELFNATFLLGQLLGGGLLFGAVFMATDYVTAPATVSGQCVYAVVIGVLTALFRVLGSTAEGFSFALLLANILSPLIERVTTPHKGRVKA